MKLFLTLLFVSCGVAPAKVPATIVSTFVSRDEWFENRTYLKDEHGHYDDVRGVWGEVGDTVYVTCHKGYLKIK